MDASVWVVGAGTMGAGIASLFLANGADVHLSDQSSAALTSADARIRGHLERGGNEPAYERLRCSQALPGSVEADLVIEAVPESAEVKAAVLAAIEARVPEKALITSNTSALSIAALAKALDRRDRFLGMHFFNPVPRSRLVELVVHSDVTRAVVDEARRYVRELGMEVIEAKDAPGFATSRLGVLLGLEAMRMLEEGVATADDIDLGMVLGYGLSMGPLRIADVVGLDTRLAIAEYLEATLGERFAPPRILREKVAVGELGRKSGAGFFQWDR